MVVNIVHIWVKKDHINDFILASLENHSGSVKEPGNLRFDILQDQDEPSRFVFYEAFVSNEAADAHKNTGHYTKWKNTVADWMEKPREGIKHKVIAPADHALW